MKTLISAMIAAFMMASVPAFAASHAGGKMDDKKMDCMKDENKAKDECKKK
ncbi:hypothetical protein [Hydrogenophaga sp.]|jgi:hypothetical protein|uniref:hypothetical protein n=1 Tax=Hydrogenophaga sp. TaxID=1904254 RepID=UPI00260F3A31|nr:hypothetical protein [Hydrogenophaga sp.]MDP2017358.1 hypothetical protein [Hydrogenophaga sp.]MDP3168608.1 hypothetical protein [Hydrogenophaga sp.]MDP3812585.1 hypothetical protein [Hydrogenophaga sp.]MDZ4104524.1 hypothetical protein [Hydrogenophaga sp.]